MLVPLVLLVGYIVVEGIRALRVGFFLHDQAGITPTEPATAGGGSHALVGTIEQVGLALVWSLPLGLAAAVFLNESRSRWRRPVRIFVDAMSGLPSIVAGLFIFAVFILPYAHTAAIFGFNGFMASLALALIMLPTITRTVEVVLRLVPDGLREASLALGASRARTTWSVVFPTARTGITTAVVLGIARAVGETAPLLFTAFGYDLMNSNPFARSPGEPAAVRLQQHPQARARPRSPAATPGRSCSWSWFWPCSSLARIIGRDRSQAPSRSPPPAELQEIDLPMTEVVSPPLDAPPPPPGTPSVAPTDIELIGGPPPGARPASRPEAPAPGSATTWCSRTSTW